MCESWDHDVDDDDDDDGKQADCTKNETGLSVYEKINKNRTNEYYITTIYYTVVVVLYSNWKTARGRGDDGLIIIIFFLSAYSFIWQVVTWQHNNARSVGLYNYYFIC